MRTGREKKMLARCLFNKVTIILLQEKPSAEHLKLALAAREKAWRLGGSRKYSSPFSNKEAGLIDPRYGQIR